MGNSEYDDGDDMMIYLIDYGITKKVEKAEVKEKIEQLKYAASPLMGRQNSVQMRSDMEDLIDS